LRVIHHLHDLRFAHSEPRCAYTLSKARFARRLLMKDTCILYFFSRFAHNQYFARFARVIEAALRAAIKS
jgi:hypothetical protein